MTTESVSRECKCGNAVTCLGGCDVLKELDTRGCWRGPNMARNANSYLTHLRRAFGAFVFVPWRIRAWCNGANRRGFLSRIRLSCPKLRFSGDRQRSRDRMNQDRRRLRTFARFSPEMHLRRTWLVCCTCIISTRCWYAHFISRLTLQ